MGTTIPVGYGQATMIFRGPGAIKNATFSMGFHNGSTVTVADTAAAIDDGMRATGGIAVAANMVLGWQYLGVDYTYMDDSGPFLGSARTTVTGTKSGSPLPTNCAFLASKASITGGRKGRGRTFFPPFLIGESGIDGNGIVDSAALAILQDYLDATFLAWTSDAPPLVPVILHEGAGLPAPVTQWELQGQIATQRRRMR